MQLAALLNHRALIPQIGTGLSQEWRGKIIIYKNNPYSRCARKQSTPSLQALAGKGVVTSLLGHCSLIALCSLAFSQVGQQGLSPLHERHHVACECVCQALVGATARLCWLIFRRLVPQ